MKLLIVSYNFEINRVRAYDSKGAYSSVLYIRITLCPHCNKHGICSENDVRQMTNDNDYYKVLACQCYPAYTGNIQSSHQFTSIVNLSLTI